jgi:hypothetical protein
MDDADTELVTNHLRYALRVGAALLPTGFGFGLIAGLSISQWEQTRLGAIIGAALPTLVAAYVTFAYYRTRGFFHYSGFGKWKPDKDDRV